MYYLIVIEDLDARQTLRSKKLLCREYTCRKKKYLGKYQSVVKNSILSFYLN